MIGPLMAYILLSAEQIEYLPIPAWKALFLGFGLITILSGVGVLCYIPEGPGQAWFLTAQDRVKAQQDIM
jgi:hypothetical protein